MSAEQDKSKHSRRIQQKQNHVARQVKLRKTIFHDTTKEPHKYHKISFANCGNSHCYICMNPRKLTGELTMQERRLFQDLINFQDDHFEQAA